MSGDTGPIILIGRGEQYWDPDDWRELVRSGRLHRGMEIAVREHGITTISPIEKLASLRAILDELDPLASETASTTFSPEGQQPANPAELPAVASVTEPCTPEAQVNGTAPSSTDVRLQGQPPLPRLPKTKIKFVAKPSSPASADSNGLEETAAKDATTASASPFVPASKSPSGRTSRVSPLAVGCMVVAGLFVLLWLSSSPSSGPAVSEPQQAVQPPSSTSTTSAAGSMAAAPPAPTSGQATGPAPGAGEQTNPGVVPTTSPAVENRPSFDCSKATEWSALQVCNDPSLAAADRLMSQLYARRMAASTPEQAVRLRDDQRAWIVRRKGCQSSQGPSCLKEVYNVRLAELNATPSAVADATPPQRAPDDASSTPPSESDAIQTTVSAIRDCVQRRDLDCAESNLNRLLVLQPGRADARRLLAQIHAERQKAFASDWNVH